jgi:division protein CdvB (Snf7/Vps24/ESCRT-III family)
LKQREEKIFKKTVQSVQVHDQETSKAYSNELAEIRKMAKLVTQSKIALEQINVRLQTVTDMGDFAATMSPAVGVVKSLRRTLGQAMPEAQDALGELGTSLNSMMLDVGQVMGSNFYFAEPDEEANKILSEASAIAEKRISEQFPEIPGTSAESSFTTG